MAFPQSSQASAPSAGGGGRRWEAPRSLPNSPNPTKWEPPSITVKDCEPGKGVAGVREGGFALGVERGREEVRCDRRDGEQAKGKCTTITADFFFGSPVDNVECTENIIIKQECAERRVSTPRLPLSYIGRQNYPHTLALHECQNEQEV